MTNDKVRQDFEAWGIRAHGWVQSALNALWDVDMYRNWEFHKNWVAYQAGRADERAEIVAKLESSGLRNALLDMVWQFCSWDDKLSHSFMSAEEYAFDVLDLDNGMTYEEAEAASKAALTKILEVI
jgi:hypothetical protein